MALVFAAVHLYNIINFYCFCAFLFFKYFFLTGTIPKGLILGTFSVCCLCVYVLCEFVLGLIL